MKKLFLLTLTLFLFGCDPVEQDTRLICDCEYEYNVYDKYFECRDDPSFKNASLVFNESNERFVFNKYNGGGKLTSEFKKDEIVRRESVVTHTSSFYFDRINLKLRWLLQNEEGVKQIVFQCRLTDGV